MDVLTLACIRIGWPDIPDRVEQVMREYRPLFTVRYSASDTAYDISAIEPDNQEQQLAEIRTMMGAYQQCR
jgi:hypothetical protein